PRYWNREDVQNWIQHMSSAHGLPSIEADRFLMNGKALCLMTMDMFVREYHWEGKCSTRTSNSDSAAPCIPHKLNTPPLDP
ncbi:Modulator of activity of ets, partial [Caligus rogercresseyi]